MAIVRGGIVKRIVGAAILALLIATLAGCSTTSGTSSSSASSPAGNGQKYTQAMYDKLETGMTLPEAESVMGGRGVKAPQEAGSGISGSVYTWKNSDGSVVTASFMSGTLLDKNHAGL
jgi:hypothetical protein